jgi:hypothetical protein
MKIKLTIILFLNICCCYSFAQTPAFKLDTVRQKIIVISCPSFMPKKGVVYYDNPTKRLVLPLMNYDDSLLKDRKYLNRLLFNNNHSLFIYDDDILMQSSLFLHKKTGLESIQFFEHLPDVGYLGGKVKYVPYPYNKNYPYYYANMIDGEWMKFTFYDLTLAEKGYREYYMDEAPKSNGVYEYYLLIKLYSKKELE